MKNELRPSSISLDIIIATVFCFTCYRLSEVQYLQPHAHAWWWSKYNRWVWNFYCMCIRHFTSTLIVMSHKINACSVLALWACGISPGCNVLVWLHARVIDVTSLPKCWWNAVLCVISWACWNEIEIEQLTFQLTLRLHFSVSSTFLLSCNFIDIIFFF